MAYPMSNARPVDAAANGALLIGRAYSEGSFARSLAYRRVSSQKQEAYGTSLDGQYDDLTGLCRTRQLPEPIIYTEVESGSAEKEEKRVEIARLVREARPGDVVVVPKADRFSRDILFTLKTFRDFVRRGVALWSVAEGFFPPDNQGETLLIMWAMQAQSELHRIRERTLGRRVALRAAGCFVEGKPPFGYKRAPGTGRNKERKLVIDPEHAPIIVDVFQKCIEGMSALALSKYLRARHTMRRFGVSWVINVLRNRVYAGQLALTAVRPEGHTFTGQLPAEWVNAHEPIVSMETFLLAQDALKGRSLGGGVGAPNSKTSLFLLRGLMRCELCGAMGGCVPSNRSGSLGYYTCRQRIDPPYSGVRCTEAPYARQSEIDETIDAATLARLVELLPLLAVAPEPIERAPAVDYDARRAEIERKRKRVVDAFTNEIFTLDDVKAKVAALDSELSDLEAERAREAEARQHETPEAFAAARDCAECLSLRWATLPIDSKRRALAILADRIVFTAAGRVAVTWRDASGFAASLAASGAAPQLAGSETAPVSGRTVAPSAQIKPHAARAARVRAA